MSKHSLLLTWLAFSFVKAFSQSEDSMHQQLPVMVKAYEQNRALIDVPAAVENISHTDLYRYSNASIVQAVNATAGVKMEERSPGSYRLNIRGSSLRSPFGVRNIKIYYNNIPFTDPGGNTYLNQLGFYNFGSIEIIKGPGSSLYGAGTGGVMLIENELTTKSPGVTVDYTGGSFGLHNTNLNVNVGNDTVRSMIDYQHQSSEGYRQQSALQRDVFSWETTARLGAQDQLTGTFLYGNLTYQTPGPLTLAEYVANPRSARPQVGSIPGSVQAKATIYQKTFITGITYQKHISAFWQNTSTVYGTYSKMDNPNIRNYSKSNEPHFGGRTTFQFKKTTPKGEITWHTGAEFQQGFTTQNVYGNKSGTTDSLQTSDEINITTYFVFTQLSYAYKSWIITGGASLNESSIRFTRASIIPPSTQTLRFNNQLAPRIALLKKVTNKLSVYASWSKGFSPPTTEEIFPTGSIANPGLAPEQGNNYEAGFKGYALKNRLTFDVNGFYFQLKNTIVQRRDVAGGDYYSNAGSTRQKGLESEVNYQLLQKSRLFEYATLRLSDAYYSFHYKNFKQLSNDFSGKQLPGVPTQSVAAGLDILTTKGWYINASYQYNDPVPLNDANTDYANAYNSLGCRVGYKHAFAKLKLDVFAGADNLLNVRYSLGNDINGFGGRYYNAAPARNYFAGISLGYYKK